VSEEVTPGIGYGRMADVDKSRGERALLFSSDTIHQWKARRQEEGGSQEKGKVLEGEANP